MKSERSQEFISFFASSSERRQLRDSFQLMCSGPWKQPSEVLALAESGRVKSSAQQAGVGLMACPAEDGAAHGVS